MPTIHDLSQLSWRLISTIPFAWSINPNLPAVAEQPALPAPVPGSVQLALRNAGILPDWNVGLNARACEWVENRHWIYQADLPDGWFADGTSWRLNAAGLDDRGWVYLNHTLIGEFHSTHLPVRFELGSAAQPAGNVLSIIFDCPPRWLGQLGHTSQMTDWKARFYYSWDWVSRLVQIGIWDRLTLEEITSDTISGLRIQTDADAAAGLASLTVQADVESPHGTALWVQLSDEADILRSTSLPLVDFRQHGLAWDAIPAEVWQPNGRGKAKTYQLRVCLLDANGAILDQLERTLGFKHIAWLPCEGAPQGADPWLCVVNDEPLFLQGFNWTPLLPNFADVSETDYRLRLEQYRDMGCNILRMWGGAHLEKEIFFDLCDQLGILVWQEFPLSSSGVDNYPPDDARSITELSEIARSYVERKHHHPCLLMWGGGNELQELAPEGVPVGLSHPLIARFAAIVKEMDPQHRFVATSSSGPRFSAKREDFGKGLHWDVHGPWKADPDLAVWKRYWQDCDALFHSEVGAPSASSAAIIEATRGEFPAMPANGSNPLWQRTSWWIEWDLYLQQGGREDSTLEEYITWSQERQAQALRIVVRSLKDKFPRVGGVIFWMGHDCFPCTANTAVINFDGSLKPAALAIQEVFRGA